MSQTITRRQLPSPSLITNGQLGMPEQKGLKSLSGNSSTATSVELDLKSARAQNPEFSSSSSEDDMDPPAVIAQTNVYKRSQRNGLSPSTDTSPGLMDPEDLFKSKVSPDMTAKPTRERHCIPNQSDVTENHPPGTWNCASPRKPASLNSTKDELDPPPKTLGGKPHNDDLTVDEEAPDQAQNEPEHGSPSMIVRPMQNSKEEENSPQSFGHRTPVLDREERVSQKYDFSEARSQKKPLPVGSKPDDKARDDGNDGVTCKGSTDELLTEENKRSLSRDNRYREALPRSPLPERSKASKTHQHLHDVIDFSVKQERNLCKAGGSIETHKTRNVSDGRPYPSDSLHHMFSLDNSALIASLHSSPLTSSISNSTRQDDNSCINPHTEEQGSTGSSNSEKAEFQGSNDQIGNCFPPMLAAAAMAALTGGRFSSSSGMAQFNPLFSQSSGTLLPAHLKNFDASLESGKMESAHRTSGNFGPSLPHSGSSDDFLSPMRAMYNTSKLLFGGGADDRGIGTPPPPSLSASASPQPACSRGYSKSGRNLYNNHLVNEEECEEEDIESMEQDTAGPEGSNSISGQQWTFEEQFKQLYVLSDEPKRKEFLDELFAYMQRRGTPVNRIPIMAKQVLDLYELFQLVVARGGLVEVINKKLWREITKGLNLPSSITSAAFTLRTQYMKYLYPYECDTLGLSTPSELQAAIDGNRREARRSSYTFDYPMMITPTGSTRPMTPSGLIGAHSSNSQMPSSGSMPIGSIFSGSELTGTPSFHSAMGGAGLSSGMQSLSGVPLPFGANNPLGLNSQLNSLNPLFGFPPGSAPPGLNLPSASAGANAHSMFPPNILPSMVSTTGSSLGNGSIQPYGSGSGNTDPSLVSPAHSSGYLIPGIPNSFAAAAAAATLFGAGFPSLPGAFATGTPHLPHNMMESSSSSQQLNSNANQSRHSPSSDGSQKASSQRTHIRYPTVNHARGGDVDRDRTSPGSPLNLTATEEPLDSQSTKASSTYDDEPYSSELDPNLNSPNEHQQQHYFAQERREKRLSGDRKDEKWNSKAIRRHPHKATPRTNLSRNSSNSKEEAFGELGRKRSGTESVSPEMEGVEAAVKWIHPGSGQRNIQRNKMALNSTSALQPDELLGKKREQTNCQQLWGSMNAEAKEDQNGTRSSEDGEDGEHSPSSTNRQQPIESFHSKASSSIPSENSATTSGKRFALRIPTVNDQPPAKFPRTGAPYTTPSDCNLKRYPGSAHVPRKLPVPDNRKCTEPTSGTQQLNTPATSATTQSMNFSMGLPNLRIQTQSGAPMGLPPNAMIVSMEFGNVLYQGVLFGQVKR